MKKIFTILGACIVLFGLSLNAQASTVTITWDEVEAWGVMNYVPDSPIDEAGTPYDAMGINFEDVLSAPEPVVRCGEVFAPGSAFDFAGSSGNVLGMDAAGAGAGFFIVLDTPAESVSFDWDWATAPGNADFTAWTGGVNPIYGVTDPALCLLAPNGYTPNGFGMIDISPGHVTFTDTTGAGITAFTIAQPTYHMGMGIDNLTITYADAPPVPIPASVLLLGTGLLPLLRLRRKS